MTKRQNIVRCEKKAISSVENLRQKNIPALLIWSHKGRIVSHGSKELSAWLNGICNLDKKNLNDKMCSEILNWDAVEKADKSSVNKIYSSIVDSSGLSHPSGIKLLPFPLELMSKKQKLVYVSTAIREEAKINNIKVVYGSTDYVPSFWLEDVWSWENVKQPLFKIKGGMYTGPGKFSEFLSSTIRHLLELKGLDVNLHVPENIDEKILSKKKRAFGPHSQPHIVQCWSVDKESDLNVQDTIDSREDFQSSGLQTGHCIQEVRNYSFPSKTSYVLPIDNPLNDIGQSCSTEAWFSPADIVSAPFEIMQEDCTGNDGLSSSTQLDVVIEPPESGSGLIQGKNSSELNDIGQSYSTEACFSPVDIVSAPFEIILKEDCTGKDGLSSSTQLGVVFEVPESGSGLIQAKNSSELCLSNTNEHELRTSSFSHVDVSTADVGYSNDVEHSMDMDAFNSASEATVSPHQNWCPPSGDLLNVTKESVASSRENLCHSYNKTSNHDDYGVFHDRPVALFKPRRSVDSSQFNISTGCTRKVTNRGQGIGKNKIRKSGTKKKIYKAFKVVPQAVRKFLPRGKQQLNSGGGACLYKAASQHLENRKGMSSINFQELRQYCHAKILDWWDTFDQFFAWPHAVTIGTGIDSRQLILSSPDEYKEFLMSDESMIAFSETEVDIWALAYVLNTKVCVLSYNLPVGHGSDGGRIKWSYYDGRGAFPEDPVYSCDSKPLYLLHEHLIHYSRVVDMNGNNYRCKVKSISNSRKVKLNNGVGGKGEGLENGCSEEDRMSFQVGGNIDSEIRPLLSLKEAFVVGHTISNLGDAKKDTTSDPYIVYSLKQLPSVDDLLQVPSDMERMKEAKLESLCLEMDERKKRHAIEMDQLEKSINDLKDKQQASKVRVRLNRLKRIELQSKLSREMFDSMYEHNLEYFQSINDGKEYSQRYQDFHEGGIRANALRHMIITNPFNDSQIDWALGHINRMLGITTKIQELQMSNYRWHVMLPEVLIKVE